MFPTKLLKHNPKEIINSIVGYDNLHFFPFGGINELVDWKKYSNEFYNWRKYTTTRVVKRKGINACF